MLPTDLKTLADRFVWARKNKGLSQTVLANAISVSQQSIEKLENGNVVKPKYLPEAAEFLGVPYKWLLSNINADPWAQEHLDALKGFDEAERKHYDDGMKFLFPDKFKKD